MLTVIILKNPFNLLERDIHFPLWQENKTVIEYCDEYSKKIAKLNSQDEIIYSLNGKKTSSDTVPKDGDYIALCPVVGKKGFFGAIFGAIAMIALSLVAPHLGTVLASTVFGTTSTIVSGLITAGIMMIGGFVISKLCPMKADTPQLDEITSASTYSWNKAKSSLTQGGALAVTYGTYLTSGTVLFRHVTVVDDDEYLIILLTGGQGLIDSISELKINELPISCYSDIEYHFELGSNTQLPMYLCEGKAYADQPLSYEIINFDGEGDRAGGWCYAITEGNRGSGVEFVFEFPQGLYSIDAESGDMGEAYCTIVMEGREISDEEYSSPNFNVRNYSDSAWYQLGSEFLTGPKNQSFSKSYVFDGFDYARFAVRVKCIKDPASQYHVNKLMWVQLSHIINCEFSRPGKVLVGLKIKATNQLSGDVNVSWLQTRNNIWAYNPHTKSYVQQPATNPAWAAYDMIHCARNINGIFIYDGIGVNHIDYDAFQAWAERCDEWNLDFNYIFSTPDDLWTALQIPEAVGLGKVLIRGTKITCIFDQFSDPVQLFTVGNINDNSFSIDYLPMLDRANAIEVSFINKLKNYQKDTISIYTPEYNKVGVIQNPTQLSLDGCVRAEQALRYAMYHLNQNHYLTRTITFDVDIDSLACTLGDQILVQHDVPLWGFGGVIIDYILDNNGATVVLDQEVIFESDKEYQILCRVTNSSSQDSSTAETLEYRNISFDSTSTNIVHLSSPFSCIPQYGDIWAIGQTNKVAKPFTVISMERKSDLQATLVCIEYEPNSMNDEYIGVDKIDYSHLSLNILDDINCTN